MFLYLIDDEIEITSTLSFRLENPDKYNILCFNDMVSASNSIASLKEDEIFLVILDHDFANANGELLNGYDLAQEIKSKSWMRGVAPVIYLTGRESEENFNAKARMLGGNAPDEFLSKTMLSGQTLEIRVEFFITRLENFLIDKDEFGLERAIEIYTDPTPV